MIKKVQAVSLEKMKEHKTNGFTDPRFHGYKVVVISIVNTDDDPIFESLGPNLSLQMDDIYPSLPWSRLDCKNYREMTFDQAEAALVHAMIYHHRCREDVFLVVNCHLGKCRSGAIAKFVQEYCGIPEEEFSELNPEITPNPWVYNLLYHVYNQKYQYGAALPAGMQNAFIPQKSNGEF